MKIAARLACLLAFVAGSALAATPPTGSFHVKPGPLLAGAPVYLVFELENRDSGSITVEQANPLTFCAGYRFDIAGEARADGTCDGVRSGSCMAGHLDLAPGARTEQEILLNYYYHFPHPGKYRIHATRRVEWWPEGVSLAHPEYLNLESDLEVDLAPASAVALQMAFRLYESRLSSTDEDVRRSAAEAIAYSPATQLETTLSSLVDTEEWEYGLAGLRNVNTPTARERIAGIARYYLTVRPTRDPWDPAISKRDLAIRYLGEMGDPEYFPLILSAFVDGSLGSSHYDSGLATAELGRAKAIPFLLADAQSKEPNRRAHGAWELSRTGSREAVTPLIDLLGDPEPGVREVAEHALEDLTHRTAVPEGDASDADFASLRSRWRSWWNLHGQTAAAYSANDCGPKSPLD